MKQYHLLRFENSAVIAIDRSPAAFMIALEKDVQKWLKKFPEGSPPQLKPVFTCKITRAEYVAFQKNVPRRTRPFDFRQG